MQCYNVLKNHLLTYNNLGFNHFQTCLSYSVLCQHLISAPVFLLFFFFKASAVGVIAC